MNRRHLLRTAAAIPFLSGMWSYKLALAQATDAAPARSRVRPGEPGWPSAADWDRLSQDVDGDLIKVQSPLTVCMTEPSTPDCAAILKKLKNPYYLADEVGLTQSLGWVGGWTSRPSEYAVAARNTDDVVAAVDFARNSNLRLVVKGGGHSYQGTSNAADSLLIWTRRMDAITLHDAFVGAGCSEGTQPQQAVTVEAGALWGQAVRRRHYQSRPLRPGWRVPDGRRCRPDPERRLR